MKKYLLLTVCQCLILQFTAFAQTKTVRVRTTTEFLKAIAPNTVIEVEAGKYDLSLTTEESGTYFGYVAVHDGMELQISKVENLTIRSANSTQKTEFITQPSYGNVFVMSECKNIKIEGITAGHGPEKGYCTGGVLKFVSSQNISIENCNLYGSGMEGITAEGVNNLKCKNVKIYECTYSLMSLTNVQSAQFENCSFTKSVEFDMLNIADCGKVVFKKCQISDNKTGTQEYSDYSLFNLSGSSIVELQSCVITGNTAVYLATNPNALKMLKTKINKNNRFTKGEYKNK